MKIRFLGGGGTVTSSEWLVKNAVRNVPVDCGLYQGDKSLRPAGHIPRAASVPLESEGCRVLFSGDIGRPDDPVMHPAADTEGADFIVVEPTCGERLNDPADGEGLITAIPEVPVFLDSPMAVDAAAIYRGFAAHDGRCGRPVLHRLSSRCIAFSPFPRRFQAQRMALRQPRRGLRWAGVLGFAWLAGCAALLPRSLTEQPAGFDSFEAAARALDQAVPYRTTTVELKTLGFDLDASPNVTLVPYPQLIARLAPNSSVPLDALDPGIRDCILARQACRVYEFHLAREARQREGNFFLDFLNFRRFTAIKGWRFDGLLVVRDGLLLFQSHAGEPRIDRTELEVRPLGPLQPAGESAGSLLRR
jgi:hypothetical protein